MDNRKDSRRIPFRKRVRYGLSAPSVLGYVANISENGIKIEGYKVFPRGSRIVIYMYLGETHIDDGSMGEVIVLDGLVSWTSPTLPGVLPRMGVKITSRNDELKRIYKDKANYN